MNNMLQSDNEKLKKKTSFVSLAIDIRTKTILNEWSCYISISENGKVK